MADELKDQRVVTMMSPSELEAIDDWMFKNRIRSRGEAIRRLCQIGMEYDRVAWPLLGAGIKRANGMRQANLNMMTAFDKDSPGHPLEQRATAMEAGLAGMQAVIDLVARIGTVWISTTLMKVPEDIREAVDTAQDIRGALEDAKLSDNERMQLVTRALDEIFDLFGNQKPEEAPEK